MMRFEKQVAVVTGAARGIGKAIAERLAREGARVFCWDILKEELVESITSFQMEGLSISGNLVDITDENSLQQAYQDVVNHTGKIDIMVNCAGIVGPTARSIQDYSLEEFLKVNKVNLTGSFLTTKHVLPFMMRQNYGRILHLTSIGGKEGNPGMVGYATSKSGLIGLIKAIGKEYAETGITVNGIAPAVIATPMVEDTDPVMLDYMKGKIPMRRLGTVEEVASLACWIVSQEASFNTGFIFDLSGGRATY